MPGKRIRIQVDICKKCGQCVDICPEDLFIQKAPGSVPKIIRQSQCIACGHCVSICPTGAVEHAEFPRSEFISNI